MFNLIVDDRERAVEPFLSNTPHTVQRITTGDFSIVYKDVIVAIFERKTLTDYAASLRDTRHVSQKQKVDDIRKLYQGCQIYYIIESSLSYPADDKKFGHIPYKDIEASIMHLQIRMGIQIIKTRDPRHTADVLDKMLYSFQKCWPDIADRYPAARQPAFAKNATIVLMALLNDPTLNDEELIYEVSPDTLTAACAECPNINAIMSIMRTSEASQIYNDFINLIRDSATLHNYDAIGALQANKRKSPIEIIYNMWTQIPGVGMVSVPVLCANFKINEYINGEITNDKLNNLKNMNNMRFLTDKLTERPNKDLQIKILQCIPNMGQRAQLLLAAHELSDIIKMPFNELASKSIIMNNKQITIGKSRANAICDIFKP